MNITYRKHLILLIKPASSTCNLKCKYCFYHDISVNRNISSFGMMNFETMRNIIKKAFDFAEKSIIFVFQGGEPMIIGLEFFLEFINFVNITKKNCTKKIDISYSIQTNGINMTEEFAKFFSGNKFLVGLSLDGTKDIHEWVRGEDTHKKVMRASEVLVKSKAEFNILCVVSSYAARHIEKIYKFFKKHEFKYLQFIPCLDCLDQEPFINDYSLTPHLYESYLKNLFNLWYDDFMSGRYISIRYFDNLVRIYTGMPSEQCGMNGTCGGQFVIESDGSVYPCDFYCVENWITGNINNMSYDDIANSGNMQKFIATSYFDTEKCSKCRYFYLCRGGCRRDRDLSVNGCASDNNIYCEALYNFYSYAEPLLKNIRYNV